MLSVPKEIPGVERFVPVAPVYVDEFPLYVGYVGASPVLPRVRPEIITLGRSENQIFSVISGYGKVDEITPS